MVKGLEILREHFKEFKGHFIIIGGLTTYRHISKELLTPRATNDIDLLIVLEKYNREFNLHLWQFITNGDYKSIEQAERYYRFTKPSSEGFPQQIELLCRSTQILQPDTKMVITPLRQDDDFSHLSAVILDDEYYKYTLRTATEWEGALIAGVDALICLKAYAYINMINEEKAGKQYKREDVLKHRNDVCRLSVLLTASDRFELPEKLKTDLSDFVKILRETKPDIRGFMKLLGAEDYSIDDVINQLKGSFLLS